MLAWNELLNRLNQMKLRHILPTVLMAAVALSSGSAYSSEKVYKWKDNRGIVHYSSKVPNDVKYEEVKNGLKKKVVDNQSQSRKEFLEKMNKEREANAQKEKVAEQEKQMTEYCNSLKARLGTVQSGQLIKTKNENGEMEYLSGTARDQEIKSLNEKISADCS